jgi:hypothetical protein
MFIDQLAKLEKQKAELLAAEAKLAADRVAALAKLPADYGFESVDAFVKAVKDAAKGKSGKARGGAKPGRKPKAASVAKGKRVRISDEAKLQVKFLSEQGKTGLEISKLLGISVPSVQNIKKALGLVKTRGAKAKTTVAASSASSVPVVVA